jgi:hypothetical protein
MSELLIRGIGRRHHLALVFGRGVTVESAKNSGFAFGRTKPIECCILGTVSQERTLPRL